MISAIDAYIAEGRVEGRIEGEKSCYSKIKLLKEKLKGQEDVLLKALDDEEVFRALLKVHEID